MFQLKYSWKFYMGVILVISNFIIAKIALAAFILYYHNLLARSISIIIYILTWPMLIVGVWWVGKEYAEALNRCFTYKFYHKTVTESTKKVIDRTKDIHSKVKEKFKKKQII